ncbi:MAG: hypothetical protein ACKPEQ_22300, partial [Dolichospermum sp.]
WFLNLKPKILQLLIMENNDKPQGKKIGWELQKTDLIFKSQWYNLRQDKISLPNNEEITYTYVEHPGAVFIIPITANQEIILMRSYRYTIDDWCILYYNKF